MKNYFDFSHFKGDLFGGITAGIVALPLALAFGVTSGLGAAFGLYGAIFIGFFAALFGGTNTQISGPTAPMTAVSMVLIAGIIAGNDGSVEKALPIILMVFFLAGLIQIGMGFAGLGKYIKFIPYPVVSGFMTAIGVLILVSQIFPFLGYYPENDDSLKLGFKAQAQEVLLDKILKAEADEGVLLLEDYENTVARASNEINESTILEEATALASKDASGVIGTFKYIGEALQNIQWVEVLLALATIFIIYGFKRITTAIPSTLVALLIVSIIAFLLRQYDYISYAKIDEIPSGFPVPRLDIFTEFSFSGILPYLSAAVTLAFLGAIDSLLTSVVADNLTRTKHQSNKELVGQGIGNSVAAIFQGIPGAGATIRTVVNINAGGKTRISGMIASLLLLVILLLLGPLASQIPAAVLAGILITVGFGVMDYRGLKAIPNMPKSEVFILILVLVLSVFWSLIYAVGIGLVIAALVFMKKMGDLTADYSTTSNLLDADKVQWEDELNFPVNLKEEVYIKHLNGPLFFGYVSDFQELASSLPEHTRYVIFRMKKVPYIDQSGLYALEEILLDFKKKGKTVLFTGVREEVLIPLRNLSIIPEIVPQDLVFEDFNDALIWVKNHVKDIETKTQ